ncbi:hypothetical protein Ait01nite_041780 [Actinoplanes italicus]|jgi:hypothetical protein|uniref:Uncharacterized protein DUF3311 n=1 Tax=Actinoplanes italicus TaxID=113567 RepID=A0A2T0K1P7_9ACTN|nr:DUF3311 domain-containing protein [Actinoplanes italicus]PRX16737.1 uncharacterized protein DUF3311 [Actinoplanes italicus]GIE31133.1 hypothetical protein Ait01nite_041780 [Actinoplanes italicus]
MADRNLPISRPRHAVAERPGLRGFFRRPDADRRNWLLLIPIVLPLVPAFYNRVEPAFLGLPFFYWCQLGFAFLASSVIAYVHLRTR